MAETNNYTFKEPQKLDKLTQPNQAKDEQLKNQQKGRWKFILDEIHYSSGPGDNIYVYG